NQVTAAEFIPLPSMEIMLAVNTYRSSRFCRMVRMQMGVRWIFGWGSREYLLKREIRRRAIDGVASYESNLEGGNQLVAASSWLLAKCITTCMFCRNFCG